jgi:hypothetical protein
LPETSNVTLAGTYLVDKFVVFILRSLVNNRVHSRKGEIHVQIARRYYASVGSKNVLHASEES